MRCKKANPGNIRAVLSRLSRYISGQGGESLREWCDSLNRLLDDALANDAFGTEGQLDPRGDHRNCCG